MYNYAWDQWGNKEISQSSSCSTNESFLFQIDCWILSVRTHPYCINLPVMHFTFLYIDLLNVNCLFFSIWNKNDSFVVHELLWLICFFYFHPDLIHSWTPTKWLSTWNQTMKSCILEKCNIGDQVKVQKVKCSRDEPWQKTCNNLK